MTPSDWKYVGCLAALLAVGALMVFVGWRKQGECEAQHCPDDAKARLVQNHCLCVVEPSR